MTVTLTPEIEQLVNEKIRNGEYRSADEVIGVAMQLFREREEDRQVLESVNSGGPLPFDERFDSRLEMLLQEAEDSGEPQEMTREDWDEIRREGLASIKTRRSN